MKLTLRALFVTFVLFTCVIGASAQDEAAVTVAFAESQPTSLDPHGARTNDDFSCPQVCEGLTNYDPVTLEPTPHWPKVDVRRSLVYTLRCAQMSRYYGSALDAADVNLV